MKNKKINISFDDVWLTFQDLNKHSNEYYSIFDNHFLYLLKKIHMKYQCGFCLYVFGEYGEYSIANITRQFRCEFESNSDWLKFGFHKWNPEKQSDSETYSIEVKKLYDNLQKIVGEKSITDCLRLHGFEGSSEQLQVLHHYGAGTFLCADDERISYDLTAEETVKVKRNQQFSKNEISYVLTDFRLENIMRIKSKLKEYQDREKIVFFSHELYFYGRAKWLYQYKLWQVIKEWNS